MAQLAAAAHELQRSWAAGSGGACPTLDIVFRRSSPAKDSAPNPAEPKQVEPKPGGKGRPTPSRREAELARKQRARPPLNRREENRRRRELMRQKRAQAVEAMKTGDERHYLARDQGPVRRFVRDFVDSRRTVVEFFLPLLVIILAMSLVPNRQVVLFANTLWLAVMVLVILDTSWLGVRLKRQIRERFPDETGRGHIFYGLARASQLRRWRLPRPQVKPGAHV